MQQRVQEIHVNNEDELKLQI